MLTIYNKQLTYLNTLQENRLLNEIMTHVEQFFPDEWMQIKKESREYIIAEAIQQGRSFGLSTDRNLTVYTDFVITFGIDFPARQPWALSILKGHTLSEDKKIDELLENLEEI